MWLLETDLLEKIVALLLAEATEPTDAMLRELGGA